jgi:hypothetical protein
MHAHTVFSTDDSLYQAWQADLLAYSHRKAGQPGPLTRLCSGSTAPSAFGAHIFQTRSYSPHPATGDDYPPYNRVGALTEWLERSPPEEETLLILDPDCVFLTAFNEPVHRGRPVAQWIGYMDTALPQHTQLLERHGYNPESVQTMGIPLLIHRDDLRAVLPLWMEKTESIRNDPVSRELARWIAEMWGYVFAAAQLGLRHELRDLAQWPMDDCVDLPFIHYCFPSHSPDGQWEWDKRGYKPWERVPDPPSGVPRAAVALISLLNELAETRAGVTPQSSAADGAR